MDFIEMANESFRKQKEEMRESFCSQAKEAIENNGSFTFYLFGCEVIIKDELLVGILYDKFVGQ